MTYYYELVIYFDDYQPPVPRFMALAQYSLMCSRLGQLLGVRIYKKSIVTGRDKQGNLLEGQVPESPIWEFSSLADLQRKIEAFSGEEYMIKSSWGTQRYGEENDRQAENFTIHFYIQGKQFIPRPESHMTHVIMEVGDRRLYNMNLFEGQIAEKNMHLLADELECLATFGVKSIRGYDKENGVDPSEHSLCYHRDLSNFVDDIYWNSEKPNSLKPLTTDIVIEVTKMCEHIEAVQYGKGILVYNSHGTHEDLRQFYKLLALKVNTNS